MRRLRFFGLLAVCVALLGVWVAALTYRPRQTPAVVVLAPPYEWPLPPLAWCEEDAWRWDALAGSTFAVENDSAAWNSKDRGLRSWERQLRRAAQRGGGSECVLLYFAMHGAVDDQGRPCLIPPGASPILPATWIPVSQLLEQIQATPGLRDRPIVMAFDAVRNPTEWNLGVLYNTFAERMAQTVRDAGATNLAVLLAAGPDERSWTSRELRGSAFAHFFQRGLAGDADAAAEGGNEDRAVSLHELTAYLRRHVARWAQIHRDARQQPLLLPPDAADVRLAWSLEKKSRDRLRSQPFGEAARAAEAAPPDLHALWRKRDELQTSEPLRLAPLVWRDFEHKLLWLEQAADAGAGYRAAAALATREVERWIEQVERRRAPADAADGVLPPAGIFLEAGTLLPRPARLPSLAAAERWGTLAPETVRQARSALTWYLESPGTAADLQQALAQAPEAPLSEIHFLRLLHQYQAPALWKVNPAPQAIRTCLRAEELAAPDDARVFPWMRAALEAADALRRETEDELWVGAGPGDGGRLSEEADWVRRWEELDRRYARAQTHRDAVARALRLRDRAFAELAWLARWITDPALSDEAPLSDREVNDRLLGLIDRAHLLAADLDDRGPLLGASLDAPPFVDRLDLFERDLEELRGVFDRRMVALAGPPSDDAKTLRRLEAALRLPLLPAGARQSLANKSRELAQSLHANGARSAAPLPAGNDDARPDDYLTRLALRWREHPALALLRGAVEEEGTATDDGDQSRGAAPAAGGAARSSAHELANVAEGQGAAVRRHLQSVPLRVARYCHPRTREAAAPRGAENADPAPPARQESVRDVGEGWSRAARLARSASSFWFPALSDDPFVGALRVDGQQLFLWRARRRLDDFWAGVPPAERAFFDLAASEELAAAVAMFPLRPATQRQLDALNALLAERRAAARGAARVTASDVLLLDAVGEAAATVRIAPQPLAASALPPGRSVVFLRDGQGRLPGAAQAMRPPLAHGGPAPTPAEVTFAFRGEQLAGRGPLVQAVAMFRGHEFPAPLVLRAPGGAVVEYRPFEYGLSRLLVEGRRQQQAAVVFVLDCSQSMREPEELEAPPGGNAPPRQVTRLDVAKNALNLLLGELAQREGWRVGVRLFGHRVGWNRQNLETYEPLLQTAYGREIPPGIRPSNDEELVLPLGRFDTVEAGKVEALLRTVKPWGETPLYLSLDRALRDFDNESPDAERFVIAITDGANRQTNPRPQDARSLNDVLAAGSARRARIYIVGFDIPAAESAAEAEFRRLAATTGGRYFPATNSEELLDALQEVLGPSTYTVSDATGREVARAEVGRTTALVPAPKADQPYTVEAASLREAVVLEGGEALHLLVEPKRGRLESVRYERGSPQFFRLEQDRAAADFLLGVHRPVVESGGVWFTVSLQRSDRGFTPRPAEVWTEVTPLGGDSSAPPQRYIFYDAPFEPDTPVPVLRRLARDWPVQFRQAQVQCWCKWERTPPVAVPLSQVADRAPEEGLGHRVPGVPGAAYQVRTQRGFETGGLLRIAVIQRHSEESQGIGSVKVEMRPPPRRAIHQFDAENGLVLHTFEYDDAGETSSQPREILFTPFDALQRGAVHLAEPVTVEIVDAGNLLELTPSR